MNISMVQKMIKNVCDALWDHLMPAVMPFPNQERWREIADCFNKQWNFPHCYTAINVKHLMLQALAKPGSLFFNYKGTFSMY